MPLRDPTLPHQPVIATNPVNRLGHPVVTCNCRENRRMPYIAVTQNFTQTVRFYNDPHNHVGDVPFTDDWKMKTDG